MVSDWNLYHATTGTGSWNWDIISTPCTARLRRKSGPSQLPCYLSTICTSFSLNFPIEQHHFVVLSAGHLSMMGHGSHQLRGSPPHAHSDPTHPKRKRSWSRAVFSHLQRKGLEKRFEVQKYVTKPDRRQLASMLGLTDAQVTYFFALQLMSHVPCKRAQVYVYFAHFKIPNWCCQHIWKLQQSPFVVCWLFLEWSPFWLKAGVCFVRDNSAKQCSFWIAPSIESQVGNLFQAKH